MGKPEGPPVQHPMGIDVEKFLKSKSLSASMKAQIKAADADGDGMISTEELLQVIGAEKTLRRERALLIRILIALGVACLLIIAAVVGLTYAVVYLSKDTSVNSGIFVSKDTNQALSTGTATVTYPLDEFYKLDSLNKFSGLTTLSVPYGAGIGIFTIKNIQLIPGENATFDTTTENVTIYVSESGISVSGDPASNATSRRRLLSDQAGAYVTGTFSNNVDSALQNEDSQSQKKNGNGEGCRKGVDAFCQSGYCFYPNPFAGYGECLPVRTLKAGDICKSAKSCENDACGRSTADDGAVLVCCPSGATSYYGFHHYCTGMAVGATCWSDNQCQTGFCQGNSGGLQKGKCQSTSKKNGESCTENRECKGKACGKLSADPTHPLLCCADGLSTYAGYDYCKNLPVGAMCWSDAMCVTGYCKGNLSGLKRGLCSMG